MPHRAHCALSALALLAMAAAVLPPARGSSPPTTRLGGAPCGGAAFIGWPGRLALRPPAQRARRVQAVSCERRDAAHAEAAPDARRRGLAGIGIGALLTALRPTDAESVPSVSWPPAAPGAAPSRLGELGEAASSGGKREEAPWQRGKPSGAPLRGEGIVRSEVDALVKRDPQVAAALLRLAFHDATARDTETGEGGANGSIVLEEELQRRENYGLDKIVALVKQIQQKSGISMADTIALAGAQAVTSVGGPAIRIPLGRLDAAWPDPQKLAKPLGKCDEATVPGGGRDCRGVADTTVPGAGLNSDGIRNYFGRLGFAEDEIVALMGAHTLGRFTTLLGVPKECLRDLNSKWQTCLPFGQRLPFVTADPDTFSNSYFRYLLLWDARKISPGDVHFLPTDVVLVVDGGFRRHVEAFAEDQGRFFDSFARAYTRLVSLGT